MKTKLLYFLIGFTCSSAIFTFYLKKEHNNHNKQYFILDQDYKIAESGYLKKGTKVKFEKGMDEGFNRYILYLNMKGNNFIKDTIETYDIVPYWLYEVKY
jgi:hypothetical protein